MTLPRLLLRLILGRRLPIAAGELRVHGPASPITIRHDRWGVPHIDAQSDDDAAFALGFCHGQDRAGQLEVLWRIGRGRLSEWVGAKGLAADRMSRRVGFRRSAEAQVPTLSREARSQIDAYVLGVNQGTTSGLSAKPHEFAILGGEPSPWDAADVLCVLKLNSYLLASNWDVELTRWRMACADGPEAVVALDPVEIGSFEAISGGSFLSQDLTAIQAILPRGGGSNNWAVAGSRTASGRPLLANDPHLAPLAPAPWYLAHVRTPKWSVAGATMVGTPAFPIGHNGFAAWGVTAGLTDNTDFFIETLSPDGGSVREADGTFTPCQRFREVIKVKGKPEVVEEVLVSPRGPILLPEIVDSQRSKRALALRAVWLDPLPLWGFLGVPQARSFEEFRHCFEEWPVLPLNLLYADGEGTIGWQLVGQLPRRKSGHGLLPSPADAPNSGWEKDLVPFAEMPFSMNPSDGILATANQKPSVTKDKLGPFLGLDFLDDYRAATIRDELGKRADWDAAGFAELQINTRSLPWEEMRGIVLAIATSDPQAIEAIDLLRKWDGRITIDSPAAAIFELFVAMMCVQVAKSKAPIAWRQALGNIGLISDGHNLFADRRVKHLVKLLNEQPAGWFTRSWPEEISEVLGYIIRRLRRDVGPAPAFWAWGHLRQLRLDHPLFGRHWLLGRLFNLGPVPCGGDQNTISQAGVRPLRPEDFPHNIANLRTVFDLGDLSKSAFALCGGQSGNPCSPHFADQFPLWQEGETIAIPWTQQDVVRAAKTTLSLVPSSKVQARS
ncbi:MAG TPA: penicillin acylase family protein [Urbifossiella sp.]|jgi:penicillin amidase